MLCDADEKIEQTRHLREQWLAGLLSTDDNYDGNPACDAGAPAKPELVPFNQLPRRTVAGAKGHAAMMHAFAHIEFNAINIAWDAVSRFTQLPTEFYDDWSRIADEEAYHFQLIRDYLRSLDYDYGSFPAHKGLWEMVQLTKHDVMVRMALVPRVLEARGLDVTPDIIARFKHHQHHKAAEILEIIYRDEIGHVEVGSKWFNYFCSQRGLDSEAVFAGLIAQYATDKIRKPFNYLAREQAGFSEKEMEYLNSCTK